MPTLKALAPKPVSSLYAVHTLCFPSYYSRNKDVTCEIFHLLLGVDTSEKSRLPILFCTIVQKAKSIFGAPNPSGEAAAETEARYRHGSVQRDKRASASAQKVCIGNHAYTGHRTAGAKSTACRNHRHFRCIPNIRCIERIFAINSLFAIVIVNFVSII